MRTVPVSRAFPFVLVALFMPGGAASAQSGSADAIVQSFARCRTIAAAEARLNCFDASAQALEKAVKAREITIADRQEVRSAQRSLFGFSIGRMPFFGGREDGPPRRDDVQQLETTIVSAQSIANGNVQLRVAEGGAVWATTDPMPFLPRPGAKVVIKRGALGNYFINVDGQRSVRGARVR